jgi:hypothetical protein
MDDTNNLSSKTWEELRALLKALKSAPEPNRAMIVAVGREFDKKMAALDCVRVVGRSNAEFIDVTKR